MRSIALSGLLLLLSLLLVSCDRKNSDICVGVSFGVDKAAHWEQELEYMRERARELGIVLHTRISTSEDAGEQIRHCEELYALKPDVVIVMSNNYDALDEVYVESRRKKIKVICYTRMPLAFGKADLFVGFDNFLIGKAMGNFLSELAPRGNYVILRGDDNDSDARDIYQGMKDSLPQLGNSIRPLCDIAVPKWSAEHARKTVRDVIGQNGGKIDAILAPNDKLAEASRLALDDLGITANVPISGFSGELAAIRRLLDGRQSMTILANYRELARTAIDAATSLARGQMPKSNMLYNLDGENREVHALLVPCQIITARNIDSRIVQAGVYTHEQVFGLQK